jgi:hypothetical protein
VLNGLWICSQSLLGQQWELYETAHGLPSKARVLLAPVTLHQCAACRGYPPACIVGRESAVLDLMALRRKAGYSVAAGSSFFPGACMVQQEWEVGGATWVAMSQDPSLQALEAAARDPWVPEAGVSLPPPSAWSPPQEGAPKAPPFWQATRLLRARCCIGGTVVLVNCRSIPPAMLDPALPHITGNALQLHLLDPLAEVPEAIGGLTSLEVLAITAPLFASRLTALPDALCTLSRLRVLELRCCTALQRLPEQLGNLAALQELRVHGAARLQALPESITRLGKLRVLNLNAAYTLRELPGGMGGLTSLEELDFGFCYKLGALPQSLGALASLKDVTVVGSGLSGDPVVALLRGRGVHVT